MGRKRPKMGWLPTIIIEETEETKRQYGIEKNADALKKVAENSRAGREMEAMMRKMAMVDIFGKKKGKKWQRQIL